MADSWGQQARTAAGGDAAECRLARTPIGTDPNNPEADFLMSSLTTPRRKRLAWLTAMSGGAILASAARMPGARNKIRG
jgi:hypothetical protein